MKLKVLVFNYTNGHKICLTRLHKSTQKVPDNPMRRNYPEPRHNLAAPNRLRTVPLSTSPPDCGPDAWSRTSPRVPPRAPVPCPRGNPESKPVGERGGRGDLAGNAGGALGKCENPSKSRWFLGRGEMAPTDGGARGSSRRHAAAAAAAARWGGEREGRARGPREGGEGERGEGRGDSVGVTGTVSATLTAAALSEHSSSSSRSCGAAAADHLAPLLKTTTLRVAYGTQTGTAKRLSQQLIDSATSSGPRTPLDCSLVNLKHYDVDNLEQEALIVFVMCTWEGGTPPAAATVFCEWLEDMVNDFRCPRTFLQNVSYAVFGLGDSEYAARGNFCKAALKLDEHMARLGARRITPFRRGDTGNYGDDVESQFGNWCSEEFWPAVDLAKGEGVAGADGQGLSSKGAESNLLSWDS